MYEQITGRAGAVLGGGSKLAEPTQTLAVRVETAMNVFYSQCQRIENTLSRVNGTPRQEVTKDKGSEPRCPMSLAESVNALEAQVERLCKLAASLELVA